LRIAAKLPYLAPDTTLLFRVERGTSSTTRATRRTPTIKRMATSWPTPSAA